MKKYPNWRSRLQVALAEHAHASFDVGAFDCCRAAADLIKAMTGTDVMHGYRGRYRSVHGALKIIHQHQGFDGLIATVTEKYGLPEIEPSKACAGDLVLTHFTSPLGSEMISAAGICLGSEAVFPTDKGWQRLPITEIYRAYQIGEEETNV